MNAIQEQMMQILRDRDEARRELEEEKRKFYEVLNRFREDSERMASAYNTERMRMEMEMRRMQEEAHIERQRLIDSFTSRLQLCPRCGQ